MYDLEFEGKISTTNWTDMSCLFLIETCLYFQLLWSVYVLLWTFLSSQTRWTYLNIKSSEIRLTFTERCTALPDEGSNLKTRTVLPVNHGISVEVECEVGYSLSGSREITCNKDKNWKYAGDSPTCRGGFFLFSESFSLGLIISHKYCIIFDNQVPSGEAEDYAHPQL